MRVVTNRPARTPAFLAVLASLTLGLFMLGRPAYAADPTPQQRLAGEVMRAALASAAATPLTSESLDMACVLASEAVALDPESAGLWRLMLDIAGLAERDDLRTRALDNISRLDPRDDNVRLQQLNLALDRYPTVEARAAAYEKLLDDDNIDRLGKPVASRLALDYALLKQRTGDIDGFSRLLTRALELDRANRSAAALAAGFFQANVNDAVGRAELLTNLVLADPTDAQTQITLAQLLLESGAYSAASRMYSIARSTMQASRRQASSELMADIAIAQWAAGDVESAINTLDRRQSEIDEAFRLEKAQTDRTMTLVQIGELSGPVDPTLAAVAAAIHIGRRDAQAKDALNRALAAYDADIAAAKSATPPAAPDDLAARYLQAAWLALWLGGDAAKAAEHVAAAEALQPLSDQAKQRFEGWQALQAGEFDRAIDRLTPLTADDTAARVGVALALERSGRAKDAARELLLLNQAQPGSMIGIWSAEQLTRILGQRLPLSQQATDLERLIASIPNSFDRGARDASMAVALRLTPQNINPKPFDPLIVTLELTNTSSLPLALDRDGPLRPSVLFLPTISAAVPVGGEPRPFVIDLDSRLSLAPRESVASTFDLRWYSVADVLNAVSAAGGIVKLVVDSNFVPTSAGQLVPGAYGVEIQAPLIRVEGVRRHEQWIEQGLATLNDLAAAPESLMLTIALLCNELVISSKQEDVPADRSALLQQVKAAIPAAFGRLDSVRQAWVLTVMNRPSPCEPALDIARKSESRLVRLAYLLFQLAGPEDPMIDAARRGEDPALRQLAECMTRQLATARQKPPAATSTVPTTNPASVPASSPSPR